MAVEKLISIQKSAFPLYWVLIVDFSDWMAASPWIMMPYNPPHGKSLQEIERERHRTREREDIKRSHRRNENYKRCSFTHTHMCASTHTHHPIFLLTVEKKMCFLPSVWKQVRGRGRNGINIVQDREDWTSLLCTLKETTEGTHLEQLEFFQLQMK